MFYFTPLFQHIGDVARLGYLLSPTGNQLVEKSSFLRRSCLGLSLTQGLNYDFADAKRCVRKFCKRNIKLQAIGLNQLLTLVHVVVQMSVVQIIDIDLNKLSRSQSLQLCVYKAKSILSFIPIL